MHVTDTRMTRRLRSGRPLVVSASVRAGGPPLASGVVLALAALSVILLPAVVALPLAAAAVVGSLLLTRHLLGDLLAGATLLLARPYANGEQVRLSIAGAEPVDAEVLQIRLLRTTLCSGSGVLVVRNSHLLHTA